MLLEARHTEFDQHVVIRLMSPALCDEKELERFRREARTLSKLESDYSARIIDVGTHSDGSFFLVRQYLEGEDLATHLRNRGAVRLDQAVGFLLQAGEVVQECHSHNIILRELQPSHLFIAQKRGSAGTMKVIDFGTAKVLKGPTGSDDPDNQATAIFGISNYWSPEMVRKGAVDPRTDVWSL
ncbi:MAG: protein kinase, partial [Deltaproteobacteria bacterium]|nr:protein kinase [Deltaproteobacteria bacterium]